MKILTSPLKGIENKLWYGRDISPKIPQHECSQTVSDTPREKPLTASIHALGFMGSDRHQG